MSKFIIAMMAVCSAVLLPRTAHGKTFTGDHYAISFGSAWDTVQTHSILGKYMGLQGMATMGADLGASLPNLDSLTAAYADSLGGEIKKDSSGRLAIGKYDVHWQKFTYDSLPKLSAAVSKATGLPTTLKKGEFRVYYLNADGVSFSIACMSIVSGVKAPYADVEAALATLTLTTQVGIIPLAPGFARDLWVKDGKLGGGWLKANHVFAVECYDTRGAFLGQATHAAEGSWQLPKLQGEMLVRLKTAAGTGLHFLVRP
jgi:hypothetical protein